MTGTLTYWQAQADRFAAACNVPEWNWHKQNGASYQFWYRDESPSVCIYQNECGTTIRLSTEAGGHVYLFDELDELEVMAPSEGMNLDPLFRCGFKLGYGDRLFLLMLEHGHTFTEQEQDEMCREMEEKGFPVMS